MRSKSSAQRQVELRRLGNQLTVLGKANSLCEVGNMIVTTNINDSENVCLLIQDHHLIVPNVVCFACLLKLL